MDLARTLVERRTLLAVLTIIVSIVVGWGVTKTSIDPRRLRQEVRLTRWLAGFDTFAASFEAGDIGVEHLDHIRKHLDTPNTRAALRADQDLVAGLAR